MANFMDAIRRTLSESTPVSELPDQQVQPSTDDVDVTDLALSDQPINELSTRKLLNYKEKAKASEDRARKRVDYFGARLDPNKDDIEPLAKAEDDVFKRKAGRQLAHDKIMRHDNVKVYSSEEVEPIDELSAGALRDYSKSAEKDFNRRRWITTQAKTDADRKARGNRAAGIALAKDKLKNKARVNANEEVMDEVLDDIDLSMFTEEEIHDFIRLSELDDAGFELNELSKKTLASYIGKATNDTAARSVDVGRKRADSDEVDRYTNRSFGRNTNQFQHRDSMKKAIGADTKTINKAVDKVVGRVSGVKTAAKKLSGQAKVNANEETEVDEAIDLKDVMKYAGGDKKFDRKSLIQKKIAANNAKKAQAKEENEMTGKSNVNEATAAQDLLSPGARSVDDPMSKFAVIQQAIGAMHAMSKDDLVKWFNDTLAQVGHEADNVGNHAASNAATLNMKPSAASASAKEDVEALFAGQDLSEEFKSSATTLFEAAVAARVAEETVRVEEEYEEALSDALAEAVEELTDQIDKYFDYAVEAWLEENEVAIESALRSELTEEFISGLRNLFLEHNISVPDENVDVVEELAARVDELEAMLDDQIAENIEFKNALLDAEIEDVVESAMDGMTLSQKEKFRTMVESIEFSGDIVDLNDKLALIKKTYFTEQKKPVDSNIINETFEGDVTEKVAVSDPNIARYVSAIGRTMRRP